MGEAIERRKFLGRAAATATVAAAWCHAAATPGTAAGAAAGSAGHSPSARARGMLVDITQCVGCRSCVYACQEANGWTDDPEAGELSGDRWTAVREVAVGGSEGARWVRSECFHCLQPSCVEACIVGALRKTPEGPVVYDAAKCIGCRYCMIACPFFVPRYQWDRPVPLVSKCNFCAPRLARGEIPACAEACPTGATQFGWRDELVAEARRRIADAPGTYVPRIYGLEEAGGTSWLFLSDVPFEELGFVKVGTEPPPRRTRAWMSGVPIIAAGIAGLLAAAYLIEGRRRQAGSPEPNDGPHRPGGPDQPGEQARAGGSDEEATKAS